MLDFGLTQDADAERDLTSLGQVIGTPRYMALEQARGQRVDGRADLFSVGVVLYRMITGTSPFVYGMAFDPVPLVASLAADIPDDLGRLIDQLLAKSAADRPADATAALEVVMKVERQLQTGPSATPTATRPDPPHPPPLRPQPVEKDRNDWSDSAARVLPDEEVTDLVPVRKSNARWILAGMAATVLLAMIVAFIVTRKGDANPRSEGTGREVAGGTSNGDPSPVPDFTNSLPKPATAPPDELPATPVTPSQGPGMEVTPVTQVFQHMRLLLNTILGKVLWAVRSCRDASESCDRPVYFSNPDGSGDSRNAGVRIRPRTA